MDDIITRPKRAIRLSAKDEILALARRHGVAYKPTALDRLGNDITRLAGDEVVLDDIELTLLALKRAGKLANHEADRLHIAYMRQKAP